MKAVDNCSWEGHRQGWKLDAFHLSMLSFYFILFFKSREQVKRQEESIMQIMLLCIMSHDWNMQISSIIYECQCLSKSVSHNLQSESGRHGKAALPTPLPEKLHFPQVLPSNIVKCYLGEIKILNFMKDFLLTLFTQILFRKVCETLLGSTFIFRIYLETKLVSEARNLRELNILPVYPFIWIEEKQKNSISHLIHFICPLWYAVSYIL